MRLLVLLSMLACGGEVAEHDGGAVAGTRENASARHQRPNSLAVVNGVRTATQIAGATFDVVADADPPNMVFAGWAGDTEILLTPGERRSAAVAPVGHMTVVATYTPLPAITPESAVLNGVDARDPSAVGAYWYFPSYPRGIIFRFHGAGGNGNAQFARPENSKFARDAIADGFAVVSLDSSDRVSKKWSITTRPRRPEDNLDVQNIQALLRHFESAGLMTHDTPIYASGMSDGAGAALRFADLLGWRASHQACVPGRAALAATTSVPGIWTMAQNDVTMDPNRAASAKANADAMAGRGVDSAYIEMPPSAVYPSRFTQIPGINRADSRTIYNAMRAAGVLDGNNVQVADPFFVDFSAIIPEQYARFTNDIVAQMNVAYAEHEFSAAANRAVLDFFAAH